MTDSVNDPVLSPNDHIRKCGVIRQSRLRVNFNTYTLVRAAEGGQRNEVRSRSNHNLAPFSELRYLGRSASRQSSLPINCDCQQTATNYVLYQSRAYTRRTRYFCVSRAPQTIYESPTARGVHGTSRVVWGRLEYIKVGVLVGLTTLLLLSRPSVSGAYLKKYTRKSTTRGISYTVSST